MVVSDSALYLDTSLIVALYVDEEASERVTSWLGSQTVPLIVSDWTLVEFTSALGIKVRLGDLDRTMADEVQERFDDGFLPFARVLPVDRLAYMRAQLFMRQYALGLRAADALHLAVCAGDEAMTLATADRVLFKAAKALEKSALRVS